MSYTYPGASANPHQSSESPSARPQDDCLLKRPILHYASTQQTVPSLRVHLRAIFPHRATSAAIVLGSLCRENKSGVY